MSHDELLNKIRHHHAAEVGVTDLIVRLRRLVEPLELHGCELPSNAFTNPSVIGACAVGADTSQSVTFVAIWGAVRRLPPRNAWNFDINL